MTDTTTPSPALATVQAIYAAFGAGDIPGMFALLDPQVDWGTQSHAPGAELAPTLQNGVGLDAARAYFEAIGRLEFHSFEIVRMLADDDTVVAEVLAEVTQPTTNKRAALEEVHVWTVRDGKAVRYRSYLDTGLVIDMYRP